MQRRFSLYRRGRIWYVQLYNPTTRKFLSGRSTGEINRNAAAGVVVHWLEEGIPEPARGRRPVKEALNIDTILEVIRSTDLTLIDAERIVRALKDRELIETAVVRAGPGSEDFTNFLARFWSYDSSPYVRTKVAHGHRIGRRRCYECGLAVKHYWKPYFRGKKLSEVRKSDLQEFSLYLAAKDLKAKTINGVLSAGTIALKWACAEELIATDPGKGLMMFSGKPARRGVLTEEEVARLFKVPWTDERARIGNLTAMSTGLRAGEVLALQVRDIGEDRLHVRHSWSGIDRLKAPKTNEERTVPLIGEVRTALLELACKNPHGMGPTAFIFWSISMSDRPMDHAFLLDGLKAALLRLILAEEDLENAEKGEQAREYWRSRRVTVHSWRHYYAARMADRLEARKVMIATGHRNGAVFEAYADHGTEEQFR
jgi:integrase